MLKCRVFDVLYFAVFQQCKIKTAKQKTASLTLAVLMVGSPWHKLNNHLIVVALRVLHYLSATRRRSTEKTKKRITSNHKMPMSMTSIKMLCKKRIKTILRARACALVSKTTARLIVILVSRLWHIFMDTFYMAPCNSPIYRLSFTFVAQWKAKVNGKNFYRKLWNRRLLHKTFCCSLTSV